MSGNDQVRTFIIINISVDNSHLLIPFLSNPSDKTGVRWYVRHEWKKLCI